jgi:hypothetical protein
VRRRRFLVLAALLVAVLAVIGTFYAEWHRRHQAALDAALVRAREKDDLNGMESLVRRGAAPRTPDEGEAMLLAAASGGRVTLARGLLARGAMIAERDAKRAGEGEALDDSLCYFYRDEESVLEQAARTPSPIPAGYLALGRFQLRRGELPAASRSFEAAYQLAQRDPTIEAALARVKSRADLARAIGIQLNTGVSVIALEMLPQQRLLHRWVALAAHVHSQLNSRFTGLRLLLVEQKGPDCRIVWRSRVLVDPRSPNEGFDDVGLHVEDLSGTGQTQVIVSKLFVGADWRPSHLDLFQPAGDRLIRRLGITSSEGFELVRLGGPGRGQIRNYFEIGWDMSHAEQPRWQSIYGWDGHHFRLVDDLYPNEFRDWAGDLRQLLKKHPEDPEILEYLAYSDQLLGHRAQALQEFRQAEHAIRAAIDDEPDRELRGRLRTMLRHTRRLAASETASGQ